MPPFNFRTWLHHLCSIPPRKPHRRRRPLAVEPLDDRVVPSVAIRLTGGLVEYTGDAADDVLVLSVTPGGLLRHNLPPGGNLVSETDQDSTLPGEQPIAASATTHLTVHAGGGNDLVDASGIGVTSEMSGGDGDDTLKGGARADLLQGGAGDNQLEGNGGSDTLLGGNGNDRLTGGLDPDLIDGGGEYDTLVETLRGTDVADLTLTAAGLRGVGADRLESIDAAELTGNGQANRLDASAFPGPVTLKGGDGDDYLAGGPSDDVLDGGNGGNTVQGESGTNRLIVTGAAGADTVSVAATAVTLNGQATTYSGIQSIQFVSGGGDDQVTIAAGVTPAVFVSGVRPVVQASRDGLRVQGSFADPGTTRPGLGRSTTGPARSRWRSTRTGRSPTTSPASRPGTWSFGSPTTKGTSGRPPPRTSPRPRR